MAKVHGRVRLDRPQVGLGPHGGVIHLQPGEYDFVVMDGDDHIITLKDPDRGPDALLARIPMEYAAEVIRA